MAPEINYVHATCIPIHPDLLKELPEDMYERLTDYSVVIKEGVRIILQTRPQTEEETVEAWAKLKELKTQNAD